MVSFSCILGGLFGICKNVKFKYLRWGIYRGIKTLGNCGKDVRAN